MCLNFWREAKEAASGTFGRRYAFCSSGTPALLTTETGANADRAVGTSTTFSANTRWSKSSSDWVESCTSTWASTWTGVASVRWEVHTSGRGSVPPPAKPPCKSRLVCSHTSPPKNVLSIAWHPSRVRGTCANKVAHDRSFMASTGPRMSSGEWFRCISTSPMHVSSRGPRTKCSA